MYTVCSFYAPRAVHSIACNWPQASHHGRNRDKFIDSSLFAIKYGSKRIKT